jgi:quercetin dioxygenase-like cupin family protein
MPRVAPRAKRLAMRIVPIVVTLLIATVRGATPALAGEHSTPTPSARPGPTPVTTSGNGPLSFEDVVRQHPLDPVRGATVTEILRGEHASLNVWQMTGGMPPHFHRDHEEIIIVKSGTAAARIGDREVTMKAGDVILIPKGTVHGARVLLAEGEPFRGWSIFAPAFDGKDRVLVDAPEPSPAATGRAGAAAPR